MRSADRPLSPHLQIYRWQLTSVLSILHRASGVALSAGTILLVWWLVAAASGPEAYEGVQDFLGSWIGLLLLFGWTLSLFYHLCNGIRHLVWDTGHALDLGSTYMGGWIVVGATTVLTLVAWIAGIARWVS
jgi:succinate dehydrogenase / fumarate reductase, cytochrome b subunit